MEAAKKKEFDVTVNPGVCKACGYCRELCKFEVFESGEALNNQGYRFMTAARQEKCVGCLRCFMVCPDFAITVKEQ